MVSAISLCLLAIGVTAASSQQLPTEVESPEAPISDRRTFKHGKPVKVLPLTKKHKKFGGFVPHVFGKTSYAEVPVFHEVPKPLYKLHRYQGVELKPLPEFSISTPEPFIETHSVEPPSDYAPAFQHSFPAPLQPSGLLLIPVNDKPLFSAPAFSSPHPGPVFSTLPPPPPHKPSFSFVPTPSQPVLPSLPITAVPTFISIARPAPGPVFSQAPAFPAFTSIPVKVQPPVLPPLPPALPPALPTALPPALPSPSPAPVFSPAPIKIPAPVTVSPPPVFSPVPVPVTPAPLPQPFPSLPPPSFQVVPAPVPSPIPSFHTFPTPAPAFSSVPLPASPEPEFPYPPSGVPIPSYIKDISLGDIELKDHPLPTLETPKFQEVTPSVVDSTSQGVKHISAISGEDGLLQKLKGWKADKANAALNHFSAFKQKPFPHFSLPFQHAPNKIPPQPSIHPLPLTQTPPFFPPSPPFFPPPKYESFPPNHVDPPAAFNSYGLPVAHDYAPPHDRLSSAASEEDPAVVPAPKESASAQNLELQQRPTAQLLQEFQSQNFQFQQQSAPHVQPIYVPEDNTSTKEEAKAADDGQTEAEDYSAPKEGNSEAAVSEAHTYRNHKE